MAPLRIYYGTDTRAAGFRVGARLAMIWSPQQLARGALPILYNHLNEFQPFLYRFGILATALASALLTIDAACKRKMEDVPALVETLSREGHLSRVVVIHLASNRPFEGPVLDEVREVLLDHGVVRAIFLNVHRPIGWEYYVNQKFVEGLSRWPQAEQGWFIRDQAHLSYAGSEAYVEAI